MIRPAAGDLIAVDARGKRYYALILSKIKLFGAPLVFAFHRTGSDAADANEVLAPGTPGFLAFVDFIWAKRENRIARLAKNVDIGSHATGATFLKNAHRHPGKASLWFIYDADFNELRRTRELSEQEKHYPIFERIDDHIMCERIDAAWTPDQDPRI